MSRADLAGRISTVEHRMDSIEQRLDASFSALSTQIVQSNRETRDTILATLRSEMANANVPSTVRTVSGRPGPTLVTVGTCSGMTPWNASADCRET